MFEGCSIILIILYSPPWVSTSLSGDCAPPQYTVVPFPRPAHTCPSPYVMFPSLARMCAPSADQGTHLSSSRYLQPRATNYKLTSYPSLHHTHHTHHTHHAHIRTYVLRTWTLKRCVTTTFHTRHLLFTFFFSLLFTCLRYYTKTFILKNF